MFNLYTGNVKNGTYGLHARDPHSSFTKAAAGRFLQRDQLDDWAKAHGRATMPKNGQEARESGMGMSILKLQKPKYNADGTVTGTDYTADETPQGDGVIPVTINGRVVPLSVSGTLLADTSYHKETLQKQLDHQNYIKKLTSMYLLGGDEWLSSTNYRLYNLASTSQCLPSRISSYPDTSAEFSTLLHKFTILVEKTVSEVFFENGLPTEGLSTKNVASLPMGTV